MSRRARRAQTLWLVLAASLVGGPPLRAATSAEADAEAGIVEAPDPAAEAAPEEAEADVYEADEIVVETRVLRPAEVYLDTPVETEVLTAEEIRTLPATNAIDVLEAIPGVQIQRQVQGQRGAVRIDGLPPEFTEILVNGQRYSGENGEAIDLGDQLFANIDRIELLRGPQALRYSPRAAGGVIDFITKDPPTDGFAISGEAGGGDQEQGEFQATVGWGNPTIGASITYDYNQIGGFDSPNRGSLDPDDGLASPFGEGSLYQVDDVYSTLALAPRDDLEFKTRLGYRNRREEFRIDDGPVEGRRRVDRWLFSQDAALALGDATTLRGTLTYSREEQDTTVGRSFRLTDDLTRLQASGEHLFELGSSFHVLTAGIDLFTNGLDVDEGGVPDSITNPALMLPDTDERYAAGGGYAILESQLASWLESEIGVRYQVREDFEPELLPQAALLFRLWRWDEERSLKLRLSAGRAVRYPTLRELYQPPVPNLGGAYFLAGNPNLDSEIAYAIRGGLEANPARWVSASVVGFWSRTSNRIRAFFQGRNIQVGENVIPANPALCDLGLLEFCQDQVSPIVSPVFENGNIDDLVSYGIEARLELRPHELVEIHAGYTWNENEVDDSNVDIDTLPNSPEHVATGRVQLTAPWTGTILTARGEWRDRAYLEGSGTGLLSFATNDQSDTSFELDLRVLQPLESLLGRRIDLFADFRNVTDNRVIDSYVVRGRSFFIGMKWDFE